MNKLLLGIAWPLPKEERSREETVYGRNVHNALAAFQEELANLVRVEAEWGGDEKGLYSGVSLACTDKLTRETTFYSGCVTRTLPCWCHIF